MLVTLLSLRLIFEIESLKKLINFVFATALVFTEINQIQYSPQTGGVGGVCLYCVGSTRVNRIVIRLNSSKLVCMENKVVFCLIF